MNNITVAIPTYEMHDRGEEVLEYSFKILEKQVYKDFDIVIGDHSADNKIRDLCRRYSESLNIAYYRNEDKRGNPASNANFVISKSTGKLIKFLCQDDYLSGEYALYQIAEEFDNTNWLFSGYMHSRNRNELEKYHLPSLNPHIFVVNTLGTPSAMTLRNVNPMPQMDENLYYAYDADFYYQFLQLYGIPKIIQEVTMINYLWENSITSRITQEFIDKEHKYILDKLGLS